MSSVVIAIAASAIAATSFAYFSDTESSSANTFAAGTLDLKIKDNDEPWGDGVSRTWVLTNLTPGSDYACPIEQIEFRNFGSVAGSSIAIGCDNSIIDPAGPESDTEEGTADMDRMLQIVALTYGDGFPVMDLAPLIQDANGNGWTDLDDLENAPLEGLLAPSGTGHLQMCLRFRPEADNDYQGDTVVTDLHVTLMQ